MQSNPIRCIVYLLIHHQQALYPGQSLGGSMLNPGSEKVLEWQFITGNHAHIHVGSGRETREPGGNPWEHKDYMQNDTQTGSKPGAVKLF